jgi:processive 1,2-diacylglycerol beta-glucosyltransferase
VFPLRVRRRERQAAPARLRPQRVLVLTAEEGEGHHSASRALAAELRSDPGLEVFVHDALREGLGRIIPFFTRDSYRVQLRLFPWTYGLEYWLFTKLVLTRGVARAGLALLCARPLSRLIDRFDPDLIVSTHPAVTSVLGHLRRRGRLDVPAVATITDLGVHAFWAHPGVDLHLVMHDSCRAPVEKVAGQGSVRVAGPIVSPAYREPRDRAAARRALGLPQVGPLVVVSGGGWGVGDVEGAARAALEIEGATVVCVSGRNNLLQARLEHALGESPRARVLGFTDRMRDLLAAADVLVDSTVGLTCLEALTCGCALVLHGAPPGHSRDSARAFGRLGLAEVADSPAELEAALRRTLDRPQRAVLPPAPSAGALILRVESRVRAIPAWRRRLVPAAAALAGTLGLTAWTVSSPTPYPLVSRALGLRPLTVVHTSRPLVGLVVEAPSASIPSLAAGISRRRGRASFAVSRVPSRTELGRLRQLGDDVLPVCRSAAFARWLALRHRLSNEARGLGLSDSFYYLAPDSFTLADYVAARTAGGHPVRGAIGFAPGKRLDASDLQAGIVIVVQWSPRSSLQAFDGLLAALAARDLRPVPLSELLASARRTDVTGLERETSAIPRSTTTSEATRAARVHASVDQRSWAIAGASSTGVSVVTPNTTGAT